MGDVESSIRRYVVRHIMMKGNESELDVEAPLLESGIITSFGIVELVQFLEKEFGITVADHEVLPENFQTIRSIANLVRAKK